MVRRLEPKYRRPLMPSSGDDPVPNLVHEAPGLHVRQRVRLEVEKSVRELLVGEVLGGVPIVAVE
jgi:hypothetical protein